MNISKVHRIATLVVAIVLGLSAGILSYTGLLSIPDQAFSNWFYDHTLWTRVDNRIAIIAIDSESEALYGSYDTWSRALLADAVSTLSENDAAVIGLDLDLSAESEDTSGDEALADACKAAGNVVAIANVSYDATGLAHAPNPGNVFHSNRSTSANPSREWAEQMAIAISYPYDTLLSAVDLGIANATMASFDGSIRNAALTVNYEGMDYDSFAVAIYKAFQDFHGQSYHLPEYKTDELFGFSAINDYYNIDIISLSDLLSGNCDSSLIEDRIILIGKYEETASNPFESFLHAIENQQDILVQASIIQALLNERTITNVNSLFQAVFFAVSITAIYLIVTGKKTLRSFLYSLAALSAIFLTGYIVNRLGYRFLLLIPATFITLIIIIGLFQNLLSSLIEKKKMEWTFKMYVDSQVVDQLTEKSPFELSRISERKAIAVLFVDIRGFTTISESLEPEQVVEILNEYLTLVAAAIAHWGGTLDKFIGDAAMALFNAPKEQNDYVLRAVCAAEEIVKNSDYIRSKFQERYGKTVSFGIGINCGDAIVGNIGSKSRMDYTAIGDTVNTASRLESNAKPGQILVSEAVWEVVKDHAAGTYIGPLSLKGKTKSVETYQIDAVTKPPKLSTHREVLHETAILHS